MARKTKTKPVKEPKQHEVSQKGEKTDRNAKDEETNSMDFGGLPNRDLKKNLGCG